MKKKYWITLVAASVFFPACHKEPARTGKIGFDAYLATSSPSVKGGFTQVVNPVLLEGDTPMYYGAVESDFETAFPTKGEPYTAASGSYPFPTSENFGLCAYTYTEENPSKAIYTGTDTWKSVSYDSGSGRWLPSGGLDWPSSEGYIDFYAFAPEDAVSSVSASGGNLPVLSYTVPSAIANQHGLLVASSTGHSTPPQLNEFNVPLGFRHILSGVRFMVYEFHDITSIQVSGVYDRGNYNMETAAWSGRGKSVATPSYLMESPGTTVTDGYKYVNNDYTLMMIPQTLPEGARITIVIDGEATPRVLDVSGQQWRAGKVVTYMIARRDRDVFIGRTESFTYDDDSSW